MLEKKEISPFELTQNPFDMIFHGWALLTAKKGDKVNSMTVSWGSLGYLWNKPTATIYVRPQRYTYALLKDADCFSLSFLGEDYRKELNYMGSHSGKDEDKYKATGLHVQEDNEIPYIQEAHTVLLCKKMYTQRVEIDCATEEMKEVLEKEMYPDKDNHMIIFGEIVKTLVCEE